MRVGGGFSIELLDHRPGIIRFRVIGKKAAKAFKNEGGIHQWQRVPPTEKKGRVHTSTITVAVLPEIPTYQIKINKKDLDWKMTRGSGAGGQHRNVTDSAVQLTHKPTKIRVRCESGRSQHANKETALQVLAARLEELEKEKRGTSYNDVRKNQIRSGNRGDNKIRIIKVQDDLVINNQNGKRISAKKYMRGQIDNLL
jgi:peptide chain release factor 1